MLADRACMGAAWVSRATLDERRARALGHADRRDTHLGTLVAQGRVLDSWPCFTRRTRRSAAASAPARSVGAALPTPRRTPATSGAFRGCQCHTDTPCGSYGHSSESRAQAGGQQRCRCRQSRHGRACLCCSRSPPGCAGATVAQRRCQAMRVAPPHTLVHCARQGTPSRQHIAL